MSDSLRRWINARDPKDPEKLRKFICVIDPRDLSYIYFYDPERKKYIDIPYRDLTRPAISKWELEAALRKLKEDPDRQPNEDLIFEGVELRRGVDAGVMSSIVIAFLQGAAVQIIRDPDNFQPAAAIAEMRAMLQ